MTVTTTHRHDMVASSLTDLTALEAAVLDHAAEAYNDEHGTYALRARAVLAALGLHVADLLDAYTQWVYAEAHAMEYGGDGGPADRAQEAAETVRDQVRAALVTVHGLVAA